jgi:predicted acylesterase/phospholipase RssA
MNIIEESNETSIQNSDIIKHIVLSGGGSAGFSIYGVLRESHQSGFWNIKNIKSIYGTSSGAIISIFICLIRLKYDWVDLDNYIIKRPWENIFKIDIYSIMSSFEKIGILNIKSIEEIFIPLFNGIDISISVTMLDFFKLTDIEIHIFGSELNEFIPVDFSYKTHPNWKLIDVVYCSCCLPLLFSPYFLNDKIYLDGGIFNNYPILECIQHVNNPDEIFGISREHNIPQSNILTPYNTTLFDYLLKIINNIIEKIISKNTSGSIKYNMQITSSHISIYTVYLAANNIEERKRLINSGVQNWRECIFNPTKY